ncbi:hypothetical protein FB107DRAFT_285953 [Schizophyllum commune]
MSSPVDDSRPPPPEPPLPKKTILGSAGSGSSSSGDDASVPRVSSDGDSSMISTDTPFHGISKDEANHYYAGIRHGGGGPKLIYRTSKDQFAPPLGPETSRGFVSFCPVPTDHCVSEVGVWDAIRPAIIKTLDKHGIYWNAVNLVCFRWDTLDDEGQAGVHTTNPTIWIVVAPDSLTWDVAHDCASELQALVNSQRLVDVDISFVESEVNSLAGPVLLAPATDHDPLASVSDALSTALSLPIAGLNRDAQGTLGAYFIVGKDLYAFTARHVLFSLDGPNYEYSFPPLPKKEVVVMGNHAFQKYEASIDKQISIMEDVVTTWTLHIHAMESRGDTGDGRYAEKQRELAAAQAEFDALAQFKTQIHSRWWKPEDRVIGHVVWAPAIARGLHSSYTTDICVIKIKKRKFKNFRGNVLSLGREIALREFIMRMKASISARFTYPENGLLPLHGILPVADIANPKRAPCRVIKRGLATQTTIGTLSAFLATVRHYSLSGTFDTDELAILSDSEASFSRVGDSGSVIVDGLGRYVGLLTSGMGEAQTSDITYATPMESVWKIIQQKFPGAELDFDLAKFMAA